jgi:hypothetical protein
LAPSTPPSPALTAHLPLVALALCYVGPHNACSALAAPPLPTLRTAADEEEAAPGGGRVVLEGGSRLPSLLGPLVDYGEEEEEDTLPLRGEACSPVVLVICLYLHRRPSSLQCRCGVALHQAWVRMVLFASCRCPGSLPRLCDSAAQLQATAETAWQGRILPGGIGVHGRTPLLAHSCLLPLLPLCSGEHPQARPRG